MNNERLDKYEQLTQPAAPAPKKPSPMQPLFFAATLIVGMFIGTNLGDKNILQVKTGNEQNPNKLVSLIDFIEDNYVDSVDKKKLIEDAITSILQNLDPHSYYISPDEMAEATEQMEGKFEGIGVEFLILRDSLMVVKTLPGGPSEKAGLKAGDRIVKVENEAISGEKLDSDKAQKLLKGKKGSDVKVAIMRAGSAQPIEFTITRGSIPIESVSASFMVNDTVGYVKVERFAQTTYEEFYKATSDMQAKGCKKVILDLRGNGGGLMDQAVKMIEEFLTEDKVVLMTDGVHQGKEEIKSSKKGEFCDMQVVVMIDQGSASASEIVAGALQDWDRSITVGRRSFGKGLVQHEIELPDKSAMRLTVARYYTPTGRCIQKPYGDTINYSDDLHRRIVKGELTNKDSIHFPDSLRYTTLGGGKRTVYGGGGIMPDIFVPIDSVYLSGIVGQLSYSGAIRAYCFNYTDKHRVELGKYKDSDDFIKKFVITDAMIAELVKNAEADKIKVSSKALKGVSAEIKMRVKAQIARNLYDDNAMYKVMTTGDRDFRKALEVAEEYKEFAAVRPNEKR